MRSLNHQNLSYKSSVEISNLKAKSRTQEEWRGVRVESKEKKGSEGSEAKGGKGK